MKPLKVFLLLGTLLLCASRVASAQSPVPETDNQSWTDVQLTVPINKQFDFVLQGTLRIGGDISTVVDRRVSAGFNFKASKHVTLNELYVHREARPANGRSEHEERLTLGATVRIPLEKFAATTRTWFEHRWREPQVDSWRFRDRVQLEHPFTIHKVQFTGFVYDEVYYDLTAKVWSRNRVAIGASHAFNKHFTGELYYLKQNDHHARPGEVNALGTALRFRL